MHLLALEAIVEECDIRLEPLDNFRYSLPPSGRDDPVMAIRSRCKARLSGLIDRHGEDARTRFEHELKSMESFASYLLLMSNFIRKAKRQGILTWTRCGSAANSAAVYSLGNSRNRLNGVRSDLLAVFQPGAKEVAGLLTWTFSRRVTTISCGSCAEQMEPLLGKG